MKALLFGIVAFAALAVRADVVPDFGEMFNPALHRIGYEIIVCTAASVLGTALLRRLAKKNWRENGEWKRPSDLNKDAIEDIARKMDEIRLTFRRAVREAYDHTEGLLDDGWQQDMAIAALESDVELSCQCKGIPIECLASEAREEVRRDIQSRFASVFFDVHRVFKVAYAKVYWKWLIMDKMLHRLRRIVASILLRRRNRFPWWEERARSRRCADGWNALCGKLLHSVVESDPELKRRCSGVELEDLLRTLCLTVPEKYHGVYTAVGKKGGIVLHGFSSEALQRHGELSFVDDADERESTWRIVGDVRGRRNLSFSRPLPLPADRPFQICADLGSPYPDVEGGHLVLIATSTGLKALVRGKSGVVVDGKPFKEDDVVVLSEGSEILVGSQLKIGVSKAPAPDAAP